MMWRAILATAALATFGESATAVAQIYGSHDYGYAPFWEQRPRSRQQWRNDSYGDWDYGRNDRRTPVTRSGGARPAITPRAPPKVAFTSTYPVNSIVIDSGGRMLYFVLSPTEAYQYPISVGREGFSWTGTETVSRTQAWPDWHPPKEMIARDPRLPDKMTGGLKNPLGAMALYLGNTLYRIHGTNDPKSIGRAASSGCFRMMNENVLHLASLAGVGTQVSVVKQLPTQNVAARSATRTPPGEPADESYSREPEPDPGDDPYYDEPRYERYQRYNPYGRYWR
ncbi:MAG: L,D-transpeptidase [Hyphomicrobium sp.]|jgi:lipoprotein-anchoring transpeptidase ErfK/SrfK